MTSRHDHVFVWVSGYGGRLVNRCNCGEPGLPTVWVTRARRA